MLVTSLRKAGGQARMQPTSCRLCLYWNYRLNFPAMIRKSAIVFLASIILFVPSVSSAKALTESQINAIVQLLIAFKVDAATVAKVESQLRPSTPKTGSIAQPSLPQANPQIPSQSQTPSPAPVATPAPTGPVATAISIQNQVCNLASTNLKTEYVLTDLLQNGNIDGRIFMNAFVLDQQGRNYHEGYSSVGMTITTSDHSNDKVLSGPNNTGPCGFHYPFQFYATKAGVYTVTYSIPTLNLSKTVTVTIKDGP